MRGYEDIVAANRAAAAQGVHLQPGAIGASSFDSKGHSAVQGGLRGHSIGSNYPFIVSRVGDRFQAYHGLNPLASGPLVDTYDEAQAFVDAHHFGR